MKEQAQAVAAERWTGLPFYELYAWGQNDQGQMGDNTNVPKSSPVQIGTQQDWEYIAAGELNSVAIKSNGTLWSWGDNYHGNVGDGTTIDRSSPVQLGALTDWQSASSGRYVSFAIKTDGTLWGWGENEGRIGVNNRTKYSSPVQVGALTNWSKISNSRGISMAVKTDGTLWTWGANEIGQLGLNYVNDGRSSPTQVGALTNWSEVAAGATFGVAIKTDGTMWSFGNNASGRLGDGTTITRSSPVQIGALTNWLKVACGYTSSAALKTDGTLWTWGSPSNGRLGNNTSTSNKSSPIQVGALTDWASVSIKDAHVAATRTDGTLWTFGFNLNGRLGDGTTNSQSSPVQVGADKFWSSAEAGQATLGVVQGSTS